MADDQEEDNLWLEYERRKKELPVLTPDQYMLAVCKIAEDLGI